MNGELLKVNTRCCPNCGCREIALAEKGYSLGKGILGIATFGLIGGLAGLHGSKRLKWRCPRCNKSFSEPDYITGTYAVGHTAPSVNMPTGEQLLAEVQAKEEAAKLKDNRTPPVVKLRIVCACGAYISIYNHYCFSCGASISLSTSTKVPAMPNNVVICTCGAKNALTNKYCAACGTWLDYSKLVQSNGACSYNEQPCTHCNATTPI